MFRPLVDGLESRLLFSTIQLSVEGTYAPPPGTGSAEIVAYDARSKRLFVVSAIQKNVAILDAADPAHPTLLSTIDVSPIGGPNSVAVLGNVVAVALENNASLQNPGKVAFYTTDGAFLNAVTVGSLPDMLTFTPDGKKLLVANEGEPSSYGQTTSVDPEGSISVINLGGGGGGLGLFKQLKQTDVTTIGFSSFNSQATTLRASGVRIFGPNATVAQDLEPEYIAVSADSRTAWVTLQENNAIATLDLSAGTVTGIVPLGYKDHSLAQNALDAGELDGGIHIVPRPVLGMYQPDAIDAYAVSGQTYLVMANEGDARDYTGFTEAVRIADGSLDTTAFPNAAALTATSGIRRLNVTRTQGRDEDGDPQFEKLYTFGARSFSIRDASGNLVFDSGDQIEQVTAAAYPTRFNASNDNNTLDNRSDDKGPEAEGVTIGNVNGTPYAFIGLERIGGVMVYDISNPAAPVFVQYINNRDFTAPATIPNPSDPTKTIANPAAGDLGPEGLVFVSASDSPTGIPLLVVANEISGTVTVFSINEIPSVSSGSGSGSDPTTNVHGGTSPGHAGAFAYQPAALTPLSAGNHDNDDDSLF